MTIAAAREWARHRSEVEWVSLAAAIAVFAYLAWDSALWDARAQLGLHLERESEREDEHHANTSPM